MSDIIEVSYTGDLLAHRRCPRSWAYEKHVGLHPYEQVQAMEGHLVHHSMEWLTIQYRRHAEEGTPRHATRAELTAQLDRYSKVLHARGIRTRFASKADVIKRVSDNLYINGADEPKPEVRAAVEGALHEEYELRTVRKLIRAGANGESILGDGDRKKKVLLTGILDVVIQQQADFTYQRTWRWTDKQALEGEPVLHEVVARRDDLEIWDYKGVRADSPYQDDYVRQVVTYAALLEERMRRPDRCVLFFTNEPKAEKRLLVIPIDDEVVAASMAWTLEQVGELRRTELLMQRDPLAVEAGDIRKRGLPLSERITTELKQQCTTCGQRFDCATYAANLGSTVNAPHPDVNLLNVQKN